MPDLIPYLGVQVFFLPLGSAHLRGLYALVEVTGEAPWTADGPFASALLW